MDRQRMEYCLAQVAAYRASGQKAQAWSLANGIKLRELASWCAHAKRWRAVVDGVTVESAVRKPGAGFVAARLPMPSVGGTVRVELHGAASRVDLHWPVSNVAELALLLREVGR